MADPSAQRPVVIVEHTPNPDSLKLLVEDPTASQLSAAFSDPAEAGLGSPIAARLLALPGVASVFVGPAFVSVTKRSDASWRELGPQMIEQARQHLESGEPMIRSGYVPSEGPEPIADDREVRRVLEQEIGPLVAAHGGAVGFVSYRDGVVELRMQGACAGCPASEQTLRRQIESRLRAAVPEISQVIAR